MCFPRNCEICGSYYDASNGPNCACANTPEELARIEVKRRWAAPYKSMVKDNHPHYPQELPVGKWDRFWHVLMLPKLIRRERCTLTWFQRLMGQPQYHDFNRASIHFKKDRGGVQFQGRFF